MIPTRFSCLDDVSMTGRRCLRGLTVPAFRQRWTLVAPEAAPWQRQYDGFGDAGHKKCLTGLSFCDSLVQEYWPFRQGGWYLSTEISMETIVMRKTEWTTPKLEILSTRKTAAGGAAAPDVFHTNGSDDQAQPSGQGGGPEPS